MNLQTLAETESTPVARLVARLGTDKRLKAEASTAISGWPERKAFLQAGGAPRQIEGEQRWITALEKPLSGD